MAQKMEVYKCELCGNIVEVVHGAGGELACCGQSMTLMTENTTDAAQEKHVPVITKVDGGFEVTVGSVAHPMEESHYIEFIELVTGNKISRKWLKPGEEPKAFFCSDADQATARAYCNLHGMWRA